MAYRTTLILWRPVLEGFFKPSIDMIIQLIESQIYDTAARTNRQSQVCERTT